MNRDNLIKQHNSPWGNLYDQEICELSENETERGILKKLRAGESISDCEKYWIDAGGTYQAFYEFLHRADQWEREQLL